MLEILFHFQAIYHFREKYHWFINMYFDSYTFCSQQFFFLWKWKNVNPPLIVLEKTLCMFLSKWLISFKTKCHFHIHCRYCIEVEAIAFWTAFISYYKIIFYNFHYYIILWCKFCPLSKTDIQHRWEKNID